MHARTCGHGALQESRRITGSRKRGCGEIGTQGDTSSSSPAVDALKRTGVGDRGERAPSLQAGVPAPSLQAGVPAPSLQAGVPVRKKAAAPPQRLRKTAAACAAVKYATLDGTSACGESCSSSLRRESPPNMTSTQKKLLHCAVLQKAPAEDQPSRRSGTNGTCAARPR